MEQKIVKQLEGFVSETYPDFFYSDAPNFQVFLDAYFEWLEKDNSAEAANAKDIFKAVPNAGALINHAPEYRDVDLTLKQFLNYFKKEVLPFAVEAARVPEPFLIKKMREVFLAKGSVKSFELLFKMLYAEDIGTFETRDFIMEASEGNFESSVVCYFKVVGRANDFDNVEFNFSNVYASEDATTSAATILDITPIGYVDSDNKLLFVAQLSTTVDLGNYTNWYISNPKDRNSSVKTQTVPSLSSITVTNSAGFRDTDVVIIKSKSSGRSTTATISTSAGPVTHLAVRNRGTNYSVGDEIIFAVDDISKGDGATAHVSEVDNQGRIVAIDGVQLRTGVNNNGVLSNNYEEALVPIQTQGRYKEFPTISIKSKTPAIMQPYGGTTTPGTGAQIEAWSESIGAIKSISTLAAGAFEDSDDIEILSPAFVRVFNPDGTIRTGNDIVVQQFIPDSEAFRRDSDTIRITINLTDISPGKTYRLPYGYDSETWSWASKDYTIDANGFTSIEAEWDSDNANLKKNEVYKVSFTSTSIVLEAEGNLIWDLDPYHFEQINNLQTDDSEFTIGYVHTEGNPGWVTSQSSGYWRTTKYFGQVYRTSGSNQLFILPVVGREFATTEIIKQLSEPRNTIVRICSIDDAGSPIFNNNLALSNIISQWSKPVFDFKLNAVWQTDKRFIDDAGFLNSPSGGVIQDSYVYSYYTYLIQTILPVGKWREIVKQTLHPAGTIMIAELKLSSELDLAADFTVKTEIGFYKNSSVFDAMQDLSSSYRAPASDVSQIYASSLDWAVNAPSAYDEINTEGKTVSTDHQAAVDATIFTTYNGNAWWDFEPVGLVREYKIDEDLALGVAAEYAGVVNWTDDELKRKITTQNQKAENHSATKVVSENIHYEQFDGSRQDMYKTNSRTGDYRKGIVRTAVTQDYYDVYDSDFRPYRFARFSDSDSDVIRGFEYSRLESRNDTRNFKATTTKRMLDLQLDQEKDLQLAMKENGSLTFTMDSENVTYTDFEAYERKWNYYNSTRIANENGGSQWQVQGYASALQNRGTHDNGNPRGTSWIPKPVYSNLKTPYRKSNWFILGDSDTVQWTNSYVPPINSRIVTTVEFDDPVEVNSTYRDPKISMRGRKS